MKKITRTLSLALLIGISGCAAPRDVTISVPFDANRAAKLLEPGSNTITGSAVIRQQGGGVVTCAGSEVRLIPATGYARERIRSLYGSRSINTGNDPVRFTNDAENYRQMIRRTTCNAAGFFSFDKVADGDFFVQSDVVWIVSGARQGGALIKLVQAEGGKTFEITLAPD